MIDVGFFTNTGGRLYWSSSPYAGNSFIAWYANFLNGDVDVGDRDVNYAVRLVRASE